MMLLDTNFQRVSDPAAEDVLKVKASFQNPFSVPLHNGRFLFDGPNFREQATIKVDRDVEPHGKVFCDFAMLFKGVGKITITVKFDSTELQDVNGVEHFMVESNIPHYAFNNILTL